MDEELKKYLKSEFEILRENQDVIFELVNDNLKIVDSVEYFCNWWLGKYPEGLFENEPKEIVEITKNVKVLLKKLEKSENVDNGDGD